MAATNKQPNKKPPTPPSPYVAGSKSLFEKGSKIFAIWQGDHQGHPSISSRTGTTCRGDPGGRPQSPFQTGSKPLTSTVQANPGSTAQSSSAAIMISTFERPPPPYSL